MAKPWPKLVRDLAGLQVRLIRPVSNGYMTIPADTKGIISSASSWRHIYFRAAPCPHCGVTMRMSGIEKSDLALDGEP